MVEKARVNRRGVDRSVASQRRAQIIQAARECISEEGVDKLTLRKVAERAQLGHASIAYYFHSRQELVDVVLVEMSGEFLRELQRRRRINGTRGLTELLTALLDPANPTARFVIQMIEAGLHDMALRRTHDEFVKYGRDSIEISIQVGIERGELRPDLDARKAAALFHSVLIWWESEILAGAVTPEQAREVAWLLVSLFQRPGEFETDARTLMQRTAPEDESTLGIIERALTNDWRLSSAASQALFGAIRSLYDFVVEAPVSIERRGAGGDL